MFPHEKFGPYRSSIDFITLVSQIAPTVPRGHGDLMDQLRRAAVSIALNIAEGTGRNTKAEMKRFYAISRGSTLECAAIFDVMANLSLVSPAVQCRGRELLNSIFAILTSICRHDQQKTKE